MFTINLYQFSKLPNSTAVPSSTTTGNSYTGVLKEDTGLISPVISFEFPAEFCPVNFNYAYVQSFSRYYFIRDWRNDGRMWTAYMHIDVLGSWGASIKSSIQYVTRSATSWDENITDSQYPILNGTTILGAEIHDWTPFAGDFQSGSYVIGVINSDASTIGAISYYVFTNAQFRSFCQTLLADPSWLGISDDELSQGIQKALVNPFQYIVSCKWFPFQAPTGSAVSTIPVGWWDFPASCNTLSTVPTYVENFNFTLPDHPQLARGAYLNYAPYAKYKLFFPPFGVFDLPANILGAQRTVPINFLVDCISGNAKAHVFDTVSGIGAFIDEYSCQFGIDIPLANMAYSIGNTAIALGQSISSGNWKQALDSLLTGATTGLTNAVGSGDENSERINYNGSLVDYFGRIPSLRCWYSSIADEAIYTFGRPLCKNVSMGTLTSFVQVRNPVLTIPALREEFDELYRLMEAGFYLA